MPKKTCAIIIAEYLAKQNVTKVFDVAGGMIAYIEDAVSRTRGIECAPCHHEQACGFSAEGYARVSGRAGVALATSGPGATNLITAIGSCFFDSTPTVFITGQVHVKNLRADERVRQSGFQETDIVSLVCPITKYAKQITRPEQMSYELEKAFFLCQNGRPGPVLLDIPINIQRTEVNLSACRHFLNSPEHRRLLARKPPNISRVLVGKIDRLLAKSRAPIVLIGGGVRLSQTMDAFRSFVERNHLPVVSSLMGLDGFSGTHSQFVGFIGSYGNRHANIALANSDLIIALGSRLDVRQTGDARRFAKHATVIQVDVDRFSFGPNVQPDISIHAELKDFFRALSAMKTPDKPEWSAFIRNVTTEFGRDVSRTRGVDPRALLSELTKRATSNAIISADVGNHQMWLARAWRTKPGQRMLFSGGMGSMGFGLPAAIGAFFAKPKSENILICGDGGFQMNLQELETVKRNRIPIKIFLFNNKSLGMVREFQDQYMKKNHQSTVRGYSVPDLKKIASAYGLSYVRIGPKTRHAAAVQAVLRSKRAVLCEVDVDINTNIGEKIMFGHALDDQYPFLNRRQQSRLNRLKLRFKAGSKA
ncbi:MAG: thiamine pyrophosphate-binding protein [Patescibacteria group bacterium]